MILYALRCQEQHQFELWFPDSSSYGEQRERGLVTCPYCGTQEVEKALMAPRIGKGSREEKSSIEGELKREELLKLQLALENFIQKNFEYVGPAFAEEARRIHYGEREEANIYGEATSDEVQELIDEEIEIFSVPASITRH